MQNAIHDQVRAKLKIASSLHRKITAIVLGPDSFSKLRDEFHNAKGFLDWHICLDQNKDPEMFGYRILVSNVIGEVSLI